jgi:mono/diheme cytochrome c family protein
MKRYLYPALFLGFYACGGGSYTAYQEGQQLYQRHCANCHMDDGSGLGELIPPLAKADLLKALDIKAACIVRHGLEGPIQVNGIEYNNPMPSNKQLSEIEITNLLNFIHNAWGNQRAFIKLTEVQAALKDCGQGASQNK